MRIALLLGLALAAGCSVDLAGNGADRCSDTEPCPTGNFCYRGFCVPDETASDASIPHARDGGGERDAGEGDAGPIECTGNEVRECYSANDQTTAGQGECRKGLEVCIEGRFSAECYGEKVPVAEILCNGRNDDCDDALGDDSPTGQSCMTGLLGACGAGTLGCGPGGGVACIQTSTPSVEVCNGADDDCDGSTDENESPCYDGASGCTTETDGEIRCLGACRTGVQTCEEATMGICRGAVKPAAIDGCSAAGSSTVAIDDDCDGDIDEDCDCLPGDMRSCYGGAPSTAGVGPCRAGTVSCVTSTSGANRFGPCMNERRPRAETCGNETVDDDCDGVRDDVPDRGLPCATGRNGVCATGQRGCVGTQLGCVAPTAAPTEACNGLDDNCNGTSDEGFDFASNATCGRCDNACGAGLSCCGGDCVDLRSDNAYCGNCGTSCGANRTCCGSSCVSTQTDDNNCGVCGGACGAGQDCCGGRCVDQAGDRNNCGMCGRACAAGQSCCGGVCSAPNAPACTGCAVTCAAGENCCAPTAPVCSNPMTDEQRCGGCGRPACAPGQLCCGGACITRNETSCTDCNAPCAPGALCCGGGCVLRNSNNCTACGDRCGAGAPDCCGSGCTSILSDVNNCGACGQPCAGVCCNGQCITDPDSNLRHCGAQCLDCSILIFLGTCRNGQCGGPF